MDAGVEKHPDAKVASTARFDVGDGGKVLLAAGCEVRDGAHFEVYDEGVVSVGRAAVIGVNNWIQGNGDVTIGEDTILGPGVVLTSTHHQMDLALPIRGQPLSKRPIVIGRDVWIGANATIAAGVRIDDHAVIGANSFVNRDVDRATTVAGSPARPIGRRTDVPTRLTLLFAVAVGITDRPARWHAISRFFATMGNTLREIGVDSWYVCHPAAAKPLQRVLCGRSIVREDHSDFGDLLDRIKPDAVFIWNGASDGDLMTRRFADERGIPCRFGELGWFPQSTTLHFDTEGTNARSSIRRLDLSSVRVDPRLDEWLERWRSDQEMTDPDRRGYVFVPLQDERDVNITLASPYATMDAFVTALAGKFPSTRFIVRPHPHFAEAPLTPHPNVEVRCDGSLHGWIKHADAVVGINSTVLLESLAWDKPTHSVGVGLATGLDVLFEADSVEGLTLDRQIDPYRRERTRQLLSELIFVRQIYRKDLHYLDRVRRAYGVSDLVLSTNHRLWR
ncbi:MAG: hypothetical protein JXQ75_13655 [Phycisphaerae bacterium]|nr:hypothetical protein [Phycisphaerae bacterium]